MFIKRLELLGFKTFADKTQIELSNGITAIVGPNGAGKSNIADALLWVLGESNVRNLRGQRTTDVIFNGSERRRAIGMAEVSLTLDNSCGTLPINFDEVTITRRAFRSGEGEYFINKTRCRLKDIYELFLDTGLGREAYSIVSQGEIDAVLSARPEDRRELFEEAAGIKKYRYRRDEALRKLERTEANLRRVCDIMAEIGGRIEPLAQQAEQAKRYNELQARLWDIEIGLLIRDLKRFTASLAEVRTSRKEAESVVEDCNRRLVELDAERTRLSSELARLEEEVEAARKVSQSLVANTQRLESNRALADERLKAAGIARERAEEDINRLTCKLEETRTRIGELEALEAAGTQSQSQAEKAVEAAARNVELLQQQLDRASRAVNEQKSDHLQVARELAAKRSALQNARERMDQLSAALARRDEEISRLEERASEASTRRDRADAEARSAKERISKIEAEIGQLENERSDAQARAADLARKHADVSHELAAVSSRLATLRETAESHEGFYEGVRSVIDAARSGEIKGVFAVVADVLTVPEGYALAIETALGAGVQDIIADSIEQVKAASAYLKARRTGRATFLPLDMMRSPEGEVRGGTEGRDGYLGIALNLVQFHGKYSPAMRVLLGKTVVADTLDNAVSLARKLSGWSKIVTLEGEMILANGSVTVGTIKGKGSGLLIRKQRIEALGAEVKNLTRTEQALAAEVTAANTRTAELASAVESRVRTLAEERLQLAENRKQVDLLEDEVARLMRQIESARRERDETEELLSVTSANAARLEEEIGSAGRVDEDLDRKVSGAQQDIEILQAQLSAAREELTRLKVELASSVERNVSVRASLQGVRDALRDLEDALRSRRADLDGALAEIETILAERNTLDGEMMRQRELLTAANTRLNELVVARGDAVRRVAELEGRIRETTSERARAENEAHEAEVKQARLEVQISQITDRLLQEYELGYEQAMEWPEEEIEIERGAATEVARLRREIKEMGPVNTGAIEEYDRVKERWDFLTAQRADLESAKAQITEAIREIDANTRDLFTRTFNAAASNFDTMFKRLFGGGTTRLSLTNPDDVLETGVEVAVQPPGKKMQDMALLSGGERALTAAALIFALLMVKPSPFVLLDEVDAPLDESNVERFAEVLKEFAKRSQFVVVTHNRATMEASDSLYGVTMEEPGVSKIISVRLAAEGPVEKEVTADEARLVGTS
ncbi:MAG: chromosome segregation protein SMC [Armatimonadota bacterium]